MTYQVPEEIPFTNDDEAARRAASQPVLRATANDEYIQFRVVSEEALVIERGLYPGAFAIRLNVVPLDADGSNKQPGTRLDLVLPIQNPDWEGGHEAPDTARDCEKYFCATDSKTYAALPTWNKMAKTWNDADGNVVSREAYEAQKQKLYSSIITTMRTRWNAMRKGSEGKFVDDTFFAQVKASKDGKYRNLRGVVGTLPDGATQLTEGFKTTAE